MSASFKKERTWNLNSTGNSKNLENTYHHKERKDISQSELIQKFPNKKTKKNSLSFTHLLFAEAQG